MKLTKNEIQVESNESNFLVGFGTKNYSINKYYSTLLTFILLCAIIFIPFTQLQIFSIQTYRFTISEFFGLLFILLSTLLYFKDIKLSQLEIGFLTFILAVIVGIFFSYDKLGTFLESSILLYFFFFYKNAVSHLNKANILTILFKILILLSIVIPTLGLLPDFEIRHSIFRHYGEAGIYYLTLLAILYPLYFSKYFQVVGENRFWQGLTTIAIVTLFIFLLVTVKMSAIAGLLVAMAIIIYRQKKWKAITVIASLLIGVFIFWDFLASTQYIEIWIARLESKKMMLSEGGLYWNLYSDAFKAFSENMWTGTGLGGFGNNVYNKHEVHSTYLKVMAETGTIGIITYLFFISNYIKTFLFPNIKCLNVYASYLYHSVPFVFGFLVTWTYTTHFRLREFWLFLIVITVVLCTKKASMNLDSSK